MKIPSFCLGIFKKKYEYWQKNEFKKYEYCQKNELKKCEYQQKRNE